MFETAEVGATVSSEEYTERLPTLRVGLLEAQAELREAPFPVLLVFAGVDGAGKGDTANHLSWWMDTRLISSHAYDRPTREESERPEFWRFWRDVPARGRIGIYHRAWYSKPLLQHAYGRSSDAELDRRLARISRFEQILADDGALILKFWMHLGRDQQEARLRALESDPNTSWQVGPRDWEHWGMYDAFVRSAERIIGATSFPHAPWRIVEGTNREFRTLEVGTQVLNSLRGALDRKASEAEAGGPPANAEPPGAVARQAVQQVERPSILSTVDLTERVPKSEYRARLSEAQARLNVNFRALAEAERSVILVFEGWDAAGKGGAIRRITAALDARHYQVISIAAPTQEELRYPYLWRFWRRLPRDGRLTIFDRSWYGRVLVERVEGFASPEEWQRAYAEINYFEQRLQEHGITLLKFWLHISPEEQHRRFEDRRAVAYKRWKLTAEDLRNREKREQYDRAVTDMVERTSTSDSPWFLLSGEDKRSARVNVLEAVCDRIDRTLARHSTTVADESELPDGD